MTIDCLAFVVSYRTADLAVACARAVDAELRFAADRLWIVDSASRDDSFEKLRAWAQGRSSTRCLFLDHNPGFGAALNAAWKEAKKIAPEARYLMFLNADIELRPGALGKLVDYLKSHPRVGIVGPRLESASGEPQASAFRFPTIAGEFVENCRTSLITRALAPQEIPLPIADRAHQADWLAGACLLIRRELFESLGGFDPEFFLYYEDVDLAKRAAALGWKSHIVPSARALHWRGASTGVTRPGAERERRPSYWFASRSRYFAKHHGPVYRRVADVAWLASHALWQMRVLIQGLVPRDPRWFALDFLKNALGSRRIES